MGKPQSMRSRPVPLGFHGLLSEHFWLLKLDSPEYLLGQVSSWENWRGGVGSVSALMRINPLTLFDSFRASIVDLQELKIKIF